MKAAATTNDKVARRLETLDAEKAATERVLLTHANSCQYSPVTTRYATTFIFMMASSLASLVAKFAIARRRSGPVDPINAVVKSARASLLMPASLSFTISLISSL